MTLVLDIVYVILLTVASPWLLWRFLFQNKSRRGWKQKLFGLVPRSGSSEKNRSPEQNAEQNLEQKISENHSGPLIWCHAVSVGEVNLLEPLICRILDRDPSVRFAISTSTETGFDLAVRKFPDRNVFFCPMDFSWAVRNTIKRIEPDLLMLTELELWPNLIRISKQNQIPVVVVNARLSESSFRGYRRLAPLVRKVLNDIQLIAVQNEIYAQRFRELGCNSDRIKITGNVKFDGAKTTRDPADADLCRPYGIVSRHCAALNAAIDRDAPPDHLFVAGSTQPEEDRIVIEVFEQLVESHPQLRLVLVPRHPRKVDAACELMLEKKIPFVRRSRECIDDITTAESELRPVVVVDVIGELAAWWSLADVGYVGGSMGSRGGQNMIEPAALGVPVCFGPKTRNFQSVVDSLLAVDAAVVVDGAVQLKQFVLESLLSPQIASARGERAQNVVIVQQGAADRTADRLLSVLQGSSAYGATQSATNQQSASATNQAEEPAAALRRVG